MNDPWAFVVLLALGAVCYACIARHGYKEYATETDVVARYLSLVASFCAAVVAVMVGAVAVLISLILGGLI